MKTLRTLVLSLTAVTGAASAPAQDTGLTRTLSSRIESGWTSNAEQLAGGTADFFLVHHHSLTISGVGEGMVLRGSVDFAETRFLRRSAENDRSAGLAFSAERTLGSGVLRGSFGLSHIEEGKALGPAGSGLGSTTPHWAGHAGLEIAQHWGRTGVIVGGDYRHSHYDDTRFWGLALAPQRTKAHIGVLSLYAVTTYAPDETLSLSARARLQRGVISDTDRADYGRVAASAVRLSAGIAARLPLRAAFSLEGGVDIVLPDLVQLGIIALPYGQARLELRLSDQLALEAGFTTDTRMGDPADGLAEWVIEGEAGISWRFTPQLGARVAGFASATRSVGFDIGTEHAWGGELSIETALGDTVGLGGTLRHTLVSGLAPNHEETRLGLALRATL